MQGLGFNLNRTKSISWQWRKERAYLHIKIILRCWISQAVGMHYQNKNWSKHRVEYTLERPLPEQAKLSSTLKPAFTHILKRWMILKQNSYNVYVYIKHRKEMKSSWFQTIRIGASMELSSTLKAPLIFGPKDLDDC